MANKSVSLSLPESLVADLNYLHRRLGISKSALVSVLLSDGVRSFRALVEALPDNPSDQDIRRFRGESVNLITTQLRDIQSQADYLDFGDVG